MSGAQPRLKFTSCISRHFKQILICLMLLLVTAPLHSQDIRWELNYESELGFKSAIHMVRTSDGDILTTGGNGSGGTYAHLTKLSPTGEVRWKYETGDENYYVIPRFCREVEPGVYRLEALRNISVGPFSPRVPFIVDVNDKGEEINSNYDVALDNILYNSIVFQYDEPDAYRVASPKLNSDPAEITLRTLDRDASLTAKYDVLNISGDSVIVLLESAIQADDAMLVMGQIEVPGKRGNFSLMKIDPAGELIWDMRFSPGVRSWSRKMLQARNGDIILAGNAYKEGDNTLYIVLIRLTSNGEKIWEKFYAANEIQSVHAIVETSENTFVILGSAGIYGESGKVLKEGSSDALIIHIGSDGRILWQTTYGVPDVSDVLMSGLQLEDGTFILGGVGKGTQMLVSEVDIFTSTGVDETKFVIESHSISPNPVLQDAIVEFSLGTASDVNLKVYDIAGRQVYHTEVEALTTGVHQVKIPVESFTTGTYYYVIVARNQVFNGSFIRL